MLCRVPKACLLITFLGFPFFFLHVCLNQPSAFSPILDLSLNLVPRSSHSLRLSRHFEYISILVGNFGHVILLCARVFSRAATILKSERTLRTRLWWHPAFTMSNLLIFFTVKHHCIVCSVFLICSTKH